MELVDHERQGGRGLSVEPGEMAVIEAINEVVGTGQARGAQGAPPPRSSRRQAQVGGSLQNGNAKEAVTSGAGLIIEGLGSKLQTANATS